jgi:hypothetical protein
VTGGTLTEDERKHVRRVRETVERIGYRREGYRVFVGETDGMRYPYVQVQHYRADTNTGEMGWGGGGKAYVSEWATDSEIFQMVLGLFIAYETHEVREAFLVDGRRVFGPHISTYALMEVCDRLDVRPPNEA